jgi:biotin carboxylase
VERQALMARLLFLGASVSQLPAIRYAKSRGHWVAACDGDADAIAFPLCDVAEVVSFADVDAVAQVADRHGVDGILAVCTDRAVVPAAVVTELLGLPGLPPAVAHAMSHKPTMRSCLAAAGVSQPAFSVLRESRLRAVWSTFPAVVKPADSGGQRGLSLVQDAAEIDAAAQAAIELSRTREAMLEEYVAGLELNTLFAVRDGEPTLLIASDRLRPTGAGFGVGWIHSFPSSATPAQLESVRSTAAGAIRALGMRDGIAFPQLIVDGDRTVIVEIAARIAAGQMADLLRHANGIEIYEIAIRQALGEPVPDEIVEPRETRPVAIRFLTAAPGPLPVGKVASIAGLDDVRAAPGVLDAGLYFGPGAVIEPVKVDADRSGYVIATADTAPLALERAEAAARLLRVEVERPPRSNRRRPGRRALIPAIVVGLLAASVLAFALTERAKLHSALVAGTRVDKTFSPGCDCHQDVAHVAFRLVRNTSVDVGIVNASGHLVRMLERLPDPPNRLVRAAWNGRETNGAVARSGVFYPEVILPALHRTLRLPSPIVVDTDAPRILFARAWFHSDRITVRYRVSEPSHAVLMLDGRRVEFTRFEPLAGTLSLRVHGRPTAALVAVDPAGNRAAPLVLNDEGRPGGRPSLHA